MQPRALHEQNRTERTAQWNSHNGKIVGARHHAPLQSVEAILTLVSGEQETRRAFARKMASAKDPELLVPYYAKLLSGQRESMPQYTAYKENTTTVSGKQIRMGYVCYNGNLAKVRSLGPCRRSLLL